MKTDVRRRAVMSILSAPFSEWKWVNHDALALHDWLSL